MMQKLEYAAVGETLYRDTLPNGLQISVTYKDASGKLIPLASQATYVIRKVS